jgi:hypothetical protein
MNSVARKRRGLSAFFYLDLGDTERRAALLTAVVRYKVPTGASLNREYARALAQIGNIPLNTAGKPRVVSGGSILRVASARGLVDNSVRASSYSTESRTFARRHVQHSLLFLRLQHPPLCDLCDLLLTDILVWPSIKAGSASASNLLGIAWLVPWGNLTSLDVAESIVHEMVHMNLNLADMTVRLFTRAPGSEFEAHSAVLRRRRPYYHAFHSACVAVSLIYFRLALGLDNELGPLRSSLERCTSELMRHRAAFTRYAWSAILAAHAFSRAPRLSAIPVHRDLTKLARAQRFSNLRSTRKHDFLRGP